MGLAAKTSTTWAVIFYILLLEKSVTASGLHQRDRHQSQLAPPQKRYAANYNHHWANHESWKPDTFLRHGSHGNQRGRLSRHHLSYDAGYTSGSGSSRSSNRAIPTFEYSDYLSSCDEDVPLGTQIITGIKLAHFSRYFHVDNRNFTTLWDGNVLNIITKTKLDADDNAGFYEFVLTAYVRWRNEMATATIRIYTKNTNDEAPRFTQRSYTASVDETAAPNTLVASVIATDKDGDKVAYAFDDGSTLYKMFKINKDTGVISLHGSGNKIDFQQDSYDLVVMATDDGSCCPSSIRPPHTTSVTATVNIIYINDHKPIFYDCKEYFAAVKENNPIGTTFIQVKALDADHGSSGKVTYSLVTQHTNQAEFMIDEINGELKTSKVFDREGDDGKLIPLAVKATDKGEPPLEGLCTLQVQIVDVNDNAPQFDRTQYAETISKNKTVGDILFYVSASDLDADQNSVIIYTLGPDNSPDIEYFDINPNSGQLMMKKQFTKQKFSFHVKATDKGVPPLSSTVPVEIELAVGDVSPPQWEQDYSHPIKVEENATINSVIGTIEAISGVPSNKKVIYTLHNGNTPPTNMKNTFVLWEETLGDKTIAQIRVNAPLDYEELNQYTLTIRAENVEQTPLAVEMTLQIHLLDVNDERPLFGSMAKAFVLEKEPIGTEVFQINAHDKDGSLLFRTVYYSIVGEGEENFKVDKITGHVTTKKVFNRETTSMLMIRILAEDGAPSSHPIKMGKPNSNIQQFRIWIGDKNDNPPHFASRLYHAEVKENEDLQHAVITVTATDLDSSSEIQYYLTEGNHGGTFAVNMDTGLIYVAGSVDYETTPSFNLTLVALDGLFTDRTNIQIQVRDVNDLRPEFENTTYEVFLKEEDGANLPMSILKVTAVDGDRHRPQELNYCLMGHGTEEPAAFRIGKTTGIIEVLKALDRDKPHGRPQWRFTVLAADEGGSNGTLYGYAEVKVNVIDINDNAPLFLKPNYKGKVKENEPNSGELVLTMTAVDYDDPNEERNAQLTYTIIKNVMNNTVNKPVFKIDPYNAEIRTNIAYLDREAIAQYIIVVKVNDGNDQSATATATIYVEDANDSPPRFEHKTYHLEIDENFGTLITPGPVLTVKVLDDDLPETNFNYFFILKNSGVGWDMFTIARSTSARDEGVLTVRQPLDYENPTHRDGFKFSIYVDDNWGFFDNPINISTAQLIITLRDINDNVPEFVESLKNVSVRKDASEGTTVATFSAVDKDNDGKSVIRYRLHHSKKRRHHFQITPNGTVKIHRHLDREQIRLHAFRVLAIDDGEPAFTSTATLVVNVLDVNDKPPAFCKDFQGVVAVNGPEVGTQVKDVDGDLLVMEACDPDGPNNGGPFTFSMDVTADSDIKRKFDLRFHSKGGLKNQGSATLFVREKLNREEQKDYKIPVCISDSGTPSLTGTSTLTVVVGDQNDNGMEDGSTEDEEKNGSPLYFDKVLYEAEVDENENILHTVITITANCPGKSSRISYKITRGNIGGAFAVTHRTGAIYVAGFWDIDYDVRKRYELRLVASDNINENFTTVVIHVNDLNDNPPVFYRSMYQTQITEEDDRNLPKRILQVTATDGDKYQPHNIVYFLIGEGIDYKDTAKSNFAIDAITGEIYVRRPLDRDPPYGRTHWRFTMFAQDEGGDGLVGYTDVVIYLKDVNDNAPFFSHGVDIGNVTENGPAGMVVMTITATDYDDPNDGTNAKVKYSIEKNVVNSSGRTIFKIDENTGVIKTAVCCLDREKTPEYSIQVVATDGGGLTGTGTVTIKIKDINDMPPSFTKEEWYVEVPGTEGDNIPEQPILVVSVKDDDLPETNNFHYKVVESSGFGADRFTMVRNADGTGSLKVAKPLDYEDLQQRYGYNFTIQVKDKGGDSDNKYHIAYAKVHIRLLDTNPNIENAEVGRNLAKFTATDADQGG